MFFYRHMISLFFMYSDIGALSIPSFVTTGNAVLGPSNVQLSCSYIPTTDDTVIYISLQAKLSGTFENIAIFFLPSSGKEAALTSPNGDYLENRVTLTNPPSSAANVQTQAVMTFNETECGDETEYKCIVSYIDMYGGQSMEKTANIVVKGKPAIPDNVPRSIPESGIEEYTDVTFTCTGNIGKPAGKFKWTRYRGSSPTEYPSATTTASEMPGTCIYNGTSTVTIRLTAEDNNAVIKCAVKQELATSKMFRQSQPDNLVVYYHSTTPTPTTTTTTTTADLTSTRDPQITDKEEGISANLGLIGVIILLSLLQIGELFVMFILYRKGIVVFKSKKEKVYEDAANNRPDNHVYSTMNSSTGDNHVYSTMNSAAGDNVQGDDRYYNL